MQVQFDMNEGIALIKMDDGKKNAITPEAADTILAALEEAEASADAIVLVGRPGAFCAGLLPTKSASALSPGRSDARVADALCSRKEFDA